MPGPQHSRKRPAKHCRGGIYAARAAYSVLSENTIYSPTAPHKDAYRGKREIAEAEQNRGVDFLTACAKQNAKEKQCDAF